MDNPQIASHSGCSFGWFLSLGFLALTAHLRQCLDLWAQVFELIARIVCSRHNHINRHASGHYQ